jgi:type I restriction enzyme S subunit
MNKKEAQRLSASAGDSCPMKLETFFEKFDQFADAPDAVAKMRELVRHLALTGTLVEQDDNDEPALALLDKIAAHKAALAKDGKLRGPTSVSPMSPDGTTRVLPSSWTWVRFGEIMVNRDGDRIPVSKEERATKAKTYDYYGASGVIDKIDGYLFDKPLLLIGEDGANLINRSTPIAFMARGQYWVNNHAHVLDGISEDFLRYIELHINAINLEPYVTGSAQPKMNQAKMNSIPIALPPLAEQKRIVAKVDELMALCDRLEAQQQEREQQASQLARASLARFADAPTPGNLHYLFHPSYAIAPADLRKSILTLAVQGKLVPQDPNDEPAEEIVRRAEAERTDAFESPIGDAELPWSLPSCWTWVRLGGITNIKHGYAFSSESFTSEPTPYVLTTPGNFYESGGFRDRGANTKYFSGEVPPSFVFNAGDLIIPMTEQAAGLLGSPAFIPNDGSTYLHNQRLGKLEFYLKEVAPEFVFWFFNSEFFRGELARTCTGMKVRHTSPKRILKVPFALPPLAEQRRIVAKVEQLMALVGALETQLAASRAAAANLLSALVAELTNH